MCDVLPLVRMILRADLSSGEGTELVRLSFPGCSWNMWRMDGWTGMPLPSVDLPPATDKTAEKSPFSLKAESDLVTFTRTFESFLPLRVPPFFGGSSAPKVVRSFVHRHLQPKFESDPEISRWTADSKLFYGHPTYCVFLAEIFQVLIPSPWTSVVHGPQPRPLVSFPTPSFGPTPRLSNMVSAFHQFGHLHLRLLRSASTSRIQWSRSTSTSQIHPCHHPIQHGRRWARQSRGVDWV